MPDWLRLTRQHVGILLAIAGAALLAFSVSVKRQYPDQGKCAKRWTEQRRESNLMELTETRISVPLLRWGRLCCAVGSLLQW